MRCLDCTGAPDLGKNFRRFDSCETHKPLGPSTPGTNRTSHHIFFMLRLTRLPNSPESPLLLLLNSAPPRLRRPLPVPLLSSVKALVAAPLSSIPHHSHPKPFSSPLRRLPPAMDLAGAFHAAAVGEATPPNPNPNVDPELHRLLGAEDASEGEAVASSFAPPSSSSSSGGSDGRRDLPEELAKGVVLLQCESSAEGGACDVYLVGTAHVSQVISLPLICSYPNFKSIFLVPYSIFNRFELWYENA